MRIACITDLHGRLPALGRILADLGQADVLLLGGDITNFGSPIDVERVVRAAQAAVPTVFAVIGNCDSAAIERRLTELGVALHGCGVRVGDVGFQGLSGIPPWVRGKGMFQLTEEELAAALEAGAAEIGGASRRVLLAHVPPHDTGLDRTVTWQHAGSTALRQFIDRTQPSLMFCGHIHEGRGIEKLGDTLAVNCGHGALGAYAVAEIGDEIHAELRSA